MRLSVYSKVNKKCLTGAAGTADESFGKDKCLMFEKAKIYECLS